MIALLPMLLASLFGSAQAATEADVEASFNSYKAGMPSFSGLSAGTVINKANADQFKDALAPGVHKMLKDGLFEIKVGATPQFTINKAYVDATLKNLNKTKLGATPGEISGYAAGHPFPEEPQTSDPRAGEKLAWNYKYGVNRGDGAIISPFYWKYRNMQSAQVEKTIKYDFHFQNFMHRTKDAPIPEITPNPPGIFRAIYVKAHEPQDLKNTQLLIQRF